VSVRPASPGDISRPADVTRYKGPVIPRREFLPILGPIRLPGRRQYRQEMRRAASLPRLRLKRSIIDQPFRPSGSASVINLFMARR